MSRNSRSSYLSKTKTAQYLLARYAAATLTGAIEQAAKELRRPHLLALGNFEPFTIDVEAIAQHQGIVIREDLDSESGHDAEIVATSSGFIVRVNPKQSKCRRRFSIAHEVAHTLFYEGTSHKIALLDSQEMEAEELICERIAAALLLPPDVTRKMVAPIPDADPGTLVLRLEQVARDLQVSVPALLVRLDALRPIGTPYLVIVTHHAPSRRTQGDARLRLWICCRLGTCSNVRPWRNRTASGMGLDQAVSLFEAWRTEARCDSGRFSLDDSGKLQPLKATSLAWRSQRVFLGCKEHRWGNSAFSVHAAHCLYAPPGRRVGDAYVVSLIKLPGTSSRAAED